MSHGSTPVPSEPPDHDPPSLEERFNQFMLDDALQSSPSSITDPPPKVETRSHLQRKARPPLEIRILGVDEPVTAASLSALYSRLLSFPYFLDDFSRNPYIFEGGVANPALAILWGRPAVGFLWLHSTFRHPGEGGEEVGYVAIATWSRSAWGRTSELKAILRATMRGRRMHRVTALICDENRVAKKFSKRLGFQQEGVSRKALCYNGIWKDVAIFGLLREDIV